MSRELFTDAELEKIRQAVVAAESATSGEIATHFVPESDPYREGEVLGAMFLSGFLSLLASFIFHHETIWFYIPLVCILFLPSRFVFKSFPNLKLPFVGRKRISQAVRDRAVRAFFEKGLYRTKDETGILIFISMLEHKVWILGDRGINARIAPDSWQELATELAAGLREGRSCEALCGVVEKCGVELARHFPVRADDTNELPDEVLK